MGTGDRAWASYCVQSYRINAEVDTDPQTYGVQTGAPNGTSTSGGTITVASAASYSSGDRKALLLLVGVSAISFAALVGAFLFKRRRAQQVMSP